MKRSIVTPATVPATALTELKQWLGISTTHDDAPLTALIKASLDMCEAFIGQVPLEATFENILPAKGGWQCLSARPVQSITQCAAIAADGTRSSMEASAYEVDLSAEGSGRLRLIYPASHTRVAVRFVAGMAEDWASLAPSLRHGILRLAAFQHRERENDRTVPQPPAAVVALWQPWRRMRLA